MRLFRHREKPAETHLAFQRAAESWLRRPRDADPDTVVLRAVPSRVEAGSDETQHDGSKNKVTGLLMGEQTSASPSRKALRRSRRQAEQNAAENGQVQEAQHHIDERLVALHQTNTSATEFYRKLYIEI